MRSSDRTDDLGELRRSLIDPAESLERQNARLLEISAALMRRVEQDMDGAGAAYAQFERAVILEDQVRQRTRELESALDLLNLSNARLAETNDDLETARADLSNAIEAVREGFALYDRNDVLVMCNSRFGEHLPDVRRRLKPGLAFADYVSLVANSGFLALPEGMSRADWQARRLRRHSDEHVLFNVQLVHDRSVQVSEHRTPNGGTVILHTDITDVVRLEREERERLLDDQARMIRATLDHLNQGVAIFDAKARLVGWNRRLAHMLHVGQDRMRIGLRFVSLSQWLRDRFEVSDERLLRLLEDWVDDVGQDRPVSFELVRPGQVTLDTFARQMPDGGFVVSFTDVTAEREAQRVLSQANEVLEARVTERTIELEDALDAAERANASKSRFVAAASHDLLQPLSAAKLYLASVSGGENAQVLQKAERALVSVEVIIEALLDISKLDSGAAQFQLRPIRLNEIFLPLRDLFAPAAAMKDLDLRVVESEIAVMSDPTFLRRILQNLIGNAVRYTETGKVLVGARRMGDSVRLEVWDTGPGIAEADQQIIFQEFQRLHARASASEGMGLGLAIVERACARLGHPLGLWSVPGNGSGFFVNVPRADAAAAISGQKPAGPAQGARLDGNGMIVLLVENDGDLRRALSHLLERRNVNVLDVAGADEAADLLDEVEITPDAMIVDYQLDGGANGIGLIERLRARHGPVPSCIISANRSSELRQACAASGLPLLNKPIDAAKLEDFLRQTVCN